LSKSAEVDPIRLALRIEDAALAERLATLLANVPGLRLVGASESADVAWFFPCLHGVPIISITPETTRGHCGEPGDFRSICSRRSR
jgi:hypothetical protein